MTKDQIKYLERCLDTHSPVIVWYRAANGIFYQVSRVDDLGTVYFWEVAERNRPVVNVKNINDPQSDFVITSRELGMFPW